MRLWSLHPRYLDVKGLVAWWREGLLARKVLCGETRGYVNHPHLLRFREQNDPIAFIDAYLEGIYDEACSRGYRFDKSKIGEPAQAQMPVTAGQLWYELGRLKTKLAVRDPARLAWVAAETSPAAHPLFQIVEGDVEHWERNRTDL